MEFELAGNADASVSETAVAGGGYHEAHPAVPQNGPVSFVAFGANNAYVVRAALGVAPLLDQVEPIVADEAEAAMARTAAASLAGAAQANQGVQLLLRGQPDVAVPLPARAVEIVLEVLTAMAECRPFSIIPHAAELTTQQAADYLNVSRPFLIGLIDRGELSHRMVGRHRRVRFADLLAFERTSAEKRRHALAEMAAEARRLDLD